MNLALVHLVTLICTASIICLMMTLAWRYFGRAQHALLWALSAGVAVIQWVAGALMYAFAPHWPQGFIFTGITVVIGSNLMAMGARSRAGKPLCTRWFITLGAAAIIAIAASLYPEPNVALRGVIANVYAAAIIAFGGLAIPYKGRESSTPERLVCAVFMLFALYQLAVGWLSMSIGSDGLGEGAAAYQTAVIIGLPASYAALGISAVFLFAADFAQRSQALILRDVMTGTFNRRGLEHAAISVIAASRRAQRELCVVLCDIDDFKAINDRFGHAAGDRALVAFSDIIQSALREEDVFGRLDGDEFCIIVLEQEIDDAVRLANRIRSEVDGWMGYVGRNHTATVSFGITCFSHRNDLSLGHLLKRANIAMAEAKALGGGAICVERAQ